MTTKLPPGFARADEFDRTAQIEPQIEPSTRERVLKTRQKTPPEIEIHTLREALEHFRARIPCRKLNDIMLAGARVGAVFVKEPTNDKYLVLFKREPYYQFSKHFPDIPADLKGHGMIANMKLVHWCALEGIKMAAILRNGRCYWIDGIAFYEFYETYDTECTFITDSVEIASPLKLWKRLF